MSSAKAMTHVGISSTCEIATGIGDGEHQAVARHPRAVGLCRPIVSRQNVIARAGSSTEYVWISMPVMVLSLTVVSSLTDATQRACENTCVGIVLFAAPQSGARPTYAVVAGAGPR